MQTECNATLFGFAPVERREVVAGFDGGAITSDAGALLLGAADRVIGLIGRFARCFRDVRRAELIEHEVETLIRQRVFGLALGYDWLFDALPAETRAGKNEEDHEDHDAVNSQDEPFEPMPPTLSAVRPKN
jgi:hypothetical protein